MLQNIKNSGFHPPPPPPPPTTSLYHGGGINFRVRPRVKKRICLTINYVRRERYQVTELSCNRLLLKLTEKK